MAEEVVSSSSMAAEKWNTICNQSHHPKVYQDVCQNNITNNKTNYSQLSRSCTDYKDVINLSVLGVNFLRLR